MATANQQPPFRIFHGPHNIAGIGRYLADWERSQGAISDFIVYSDNTHRQNSHINLHLERGGVFKRFFSMLAFFWLCLFRYDLFHFYFGKTLLPLNLDLPLLKLFGKKMIMTYVGSDVRLYEVERQRNQYHALRSVGNLAPEMDGKKKRMLAWQGLWIDRVIAVRNLYASVSRVIPARKIIRDIWVTNTIDLAEFTPNYVVHSVPVLVHAPTNSLKKGSDQIEAAIQALKERGYCFEYVRVQHMPHDEAVRVFQNADIIVDQLLSGGFGNLSMEGMAYGKPVCAYVIDEIRRDLPDLPVVQITVETVAEKLAWLIEHPEQRVRIGQEGRAFAEKYYDREKTARKLWRLYQDLMGRPQEVASDL